MLKNLTILSHKPMMGMVIPDLLTEVNKPPGYHPKVSILTNSQRQLLNRIKGKAVHRGGNNQPPPLRGNTGRDPDPDDDNDDDNDNDKDGHDGRSRRGGRPEHNSQRASLPRDVSRTRTMLEFRQTLSTSQRPTKNTAEPRYLFQREDNQDVRNWLTPYEDYFDRKSTQ